MPPTGNPIDLQRLLALRATGMGVVRLCKAFRVGPARLREILAKHGDRPEKAHRPGQDGFMRPSGTSRLPPCPICEARVHPVELRCRECGVVMHPEWEKPGPWWVEKRCRGCARRVNGA